MLNNADRVAKISKLLKNLHDPLIRFVSEPYIEELKLLKEENFQNLKDLCKEYNIRYVFINESEICVCENKRTKSDGPAIWELVERLGISGGAGNRDQHQCTYGLLYFPEEAYGGWDLQENKKLSHDEILEKNFRHVVTRSHFKPIKEK